MCNKRIVKVFLLLFALAATQVQCKHQHQQSGNRHNRNSGKFSSYFNLITAINANLFSAAHTNHAHIRNSSQDSFQSTAAFRPWLKVLGMTPSVGTTTATVHLSTSLVTDQSLLPRSLQKVRQLSLTYLCVVLEKRRKKMFFRENAQNFKRFSVFRDDDCFFGLWGKCL